MAGVTTSQSDRCCPWDAVYDVRQRPDGLYEGKWRVHHSLPTEHSVVFKQTDTVIETKQGRRVHTYKELVDGPQELTKALTDWSRPLTNKAKANKALPMTKEKRPRYCFTEEEDKTLLQLAIKHSNNFEQVAKEMSEMYTATGRTPRIRQTLYKRYKKISTSVCQDKCDDPSPNTSQLQQGQTETIQATPGVSSSTHDA